MHKMIFAFLRLWAYLKTVFSQWAGFQGKRRKICFFVMGLLLIPYILLSQAPGIEPNNQALQVISRWADGPCKAVQTVNRISYLGTGGCLNIVDFRYAPGGTLLSRTLCPGPVEEIAVKGRYAYVGCEKYGIKIYDITNPYRPVEAGSFRAEWDYWKQIMIKDHYAYIIQNFRLHVLDIAVPAHPVIVWEKEFGNLPQCMDVDDNNVYVDVPYNSVWVINRRHPEQAFIIDYAAWEEPETVHFAAGIAVQDRILYINDIKRKLRVIDISDPTTPLLVGTLDIPGQPAAMELKGHRLYLVSAPCLYCIDVSAPQTPVITGKFSLTQSDAPGLSVSGRLAFIPAMDDGMVVIDVSNPALPVLSGTYEIPGSVRSLAVNGKYVYLVHGSRLQVLDISAPAQPVLAASKKIDFGCSRLQPLHITIQGRYAYVLGREKLFVLDIAKPAQPVKTAEYAYGGEHMAVKNRYAYVAKGGAEQPGLIILDVADPARITETAALDLERNLTCYGIYVQGNYAYLAEHNGAHIIDISDAAYPVETACLSYKEGYTHIFSLAVNGNYLYVPLVFEAALRILDITDHYKPVLVGNLPLPVNSVSRYCVLQEPWLYLSGNDAALLALDISHPGQPVVASCFPMARFAGVAAARDNLVFINSEDDGLYILINNQAQCIK